MINKNELRIGNLISLGNRIAKIAEISTNSCLVYDLEETQDTIESYNRCAPIPLTEEWMIKFGINKREGEEGNNNWQFWYKGIFNIYKEKEGFMFEVYTHYIPIDYVHQLQNLYFILKNEELTIQK